MDDHLRPDVELLWRYHHLDHEPRRTDVGVGLGSHDLGVADHTAELYHAGRFPLVVFTGANAPTTVDLFPRGEAVHFGEHARARGVPAAAIRLETRATNTGENITFTRDLLRDHDIREVTLVSRPYQQRRAYATCRKLWPEVDVVCAAKPQTLDEHLRTIGDDDRVINMLVGDTQRITLYAERGFAIPQPFPADVHNALQRLIAAGFTKRLV
ncbi:YdcF family protein [Amycolatopsis thermoflava]|uniref:YdcF family protein n=1 Tax=Amycolatopsis thermoflava TaxID=84480 RepID=UPI0004061491|nr:YdcF family protein [Amycolatopsis thermoflava]